MNRTRAVALVSVLSFAVSVSACSSDDGGERTDRSKATTTTIDVGTEARYARRGPNQVGSMTIALDDGRRVVIWYPAARSAAKQPSEQFDIASLLSPELQSHIPADLRPEYEIGAHIGAEPATDGPYPVVLFSHGFAGFPEQSADLVTHLASWGFVVIAPDHVERSLSGLLGTAAKGVPPRSDSDVLSASLDAAVADAKRSNSPLKGLLDLDHVAVTGHSAGAEAAYVTAAKDDRIKAFISYSVGFGDPAHPAKIPAAPKVPGMVMLATMDGIIPPAASRSVFQLMNAPKYRVEIANAGHLVFSDICRIGRDQGGLVALVKQAKLAIPDDLLELAHDGCDPGDLKPELAFGAIDHLSVAFLRATFGIDKEPVGLDPGVTKAFTGADIALTADP